MVADDQNPPGENGGFDRGYEGHARRQAWAGLRLTPAARLRWLERTMEELRRVVGRARQVEGNGPLRGDSEMEV